jgi:hypothetical protein
MTVGSVEAVTEAAIFAALTYIGFPAAGYFLHALGTVFYSAAAFDSTDSGVAHTRWAGPVHHTHLLHHTVHYPPHRLMTSEYITESGGVTYKGSLPAWIFPISV